MIGTRTLRIDACNAVMWFLRDAAKDPNAMFIRKLEPEQQAEAREYLLGLAEIARRHGAVPVSKDAKDEEQPCE